MTESVKVIVRCRPLVDKESKMDCKTIIDVEKSTNQMSISKPGDPDLIKTFRFDEVFDSNSTQQQVYDEAAFPLVESASEGYNGTVFAYGQTGCGKTHTMVGSLDDDNLKGIMPKSFTHIFSTINSENTKGLQYLIRCSFIEIYNEEIRDLLSPDQSHKKKLEIKEDPNKGVYIKDCLIKIAQTSADLEKALKDGNKNKTMGETLMNIDSSRSHCIFTIYIETSENLQNGKQKIRMGKLNLVDLAGSEKQKKTGATGQRLKEATKINLSLSALMNVITCLVDGKSTHIPYRDSKLTRLLQDSLGGNTKTCMIANISPADYNYDETLSTLRYADRAKNIKNKPKINEDPKDALLREYAEEIKKLREQLASVSTVQSNQLQPPQHNNLTQSVTINSNQSQMENLKPVSSTLHQSQSLSQSPMMRRGPNNKLGPEVNSSGGSLMSRKKPTSNSQVGEDEFILSNSEFLTDDENQSRNKMTPSSMVKNKINSQILQEEKKNDQIDEQLRQKQLEEENRIKAALEIKIHELEEKLQHDGNQIIEAQQQKMQAYREFQIKLKQQKQREREILEAKQRQEEDMMNVEKNYQSLQEEVDDMRKLIKKFRIKYKQAVNEIKDLNMEHNKEKADLFETLQEFEKENVLYRDLFRVLLSEREMNKIISKCEYDADNKKWDVPVFVIKEKAVQLPKMPLGANTNKAKHDFKKQFGDEARSKNAILILDKTDDIESPDFKNRLSRENSYNKKSMSQTNYDRWKDFSQGRKQLQDFAEGSGVKNEINIVPVNLQGASTIAKYQNSVNSFTTSPSRDISIERQVSIVPNKKQKKIVKLKPLIPPMQQSISQVKPISELQGSFRGALSDTNEPIVLNDLKYQQKLGTPSSALLNNSSSQLGNSIGGKIKLPTKINLSKKLDPIAKKNLIQQLKTSLNKDKNSSNIQTTNNNNTNYNIVNFNFYNKTTPQNKATSGCRENSNRKEVDEKRKQSTELIAQPPIDIEDY